MTLTKLLLSAALCGAFAAQMNAQAPARGGRGGAGAGGEPAFHVGTGGSGKGAVRAELRQLPRREP